MAFTVFEFDGIPPINKRLPVDIMSSPHDLGGEQHIGQLIDSQIPAFIMRVLQHQNDPHTMIVDGRDVSVDGAKLDTIETGAEVNNLSDAQANSLTSGSHTNWHNHDDFYYKKSQLYSPNESQINWFNLINVPTTFTPSVHNHDSIYYTEGEVDSILQNYYTKLELNDGQLDNRYFTESEITSNYYTKTQLDAGQLDGRYYTESEINTLLLGKSDTTHLHDDRYYTESETDSLLTSKSDINHLHDDRYYTESEVNDIISNYYTKTQLDAGQLDNRYYTESETNSIISNYYTKVQLDAGQLDGRYYTELEVDQLITAATFGIAGAVETYADLPTLNDSGLIYIVRTNTDKSEGFYQWTGSAWVFLAENTGTSVHNQLTGLNDGEYKHLTQVQYSDLTAGLNSILHNHDSRYYTESEIDQAISNYYTKVQLDAGQLDNRYYTEGEMNILLLGKSDTTHLHDDRYYTEVETNLLLDTKSDITHLHDDRYYTESEIDLLLTSKSDIAHLHDDRYYTESEADVLFDGKINKILNPVVNNFPTQTSTGLQDSGYNPESFALASHNHSTVNITSGVLPLVRGGTNNDTYISGRFITYDGTRLSSSAYTNTSFAAASHNHSAANITSGTLAIVRGGTNATTYTANKFLIYNGTSIVASTYDQASFSLSSHTHTKSNITDFIETNYVHTTGDETIAGNKTFTGNISIQGILTTINSVDLSINDNEIVLNNGEPGAGVTEGWSGIAVDRGTLDDAYLRFDEVSKTWKAGIGLTLYDISLSNHIHDDRYYTESEIDSLLNTKSDIAHLHDDRYFTELEITSNYYTKTQSDGLYSQLNHAHDDRYYTESEINNLFYTKTQSDSLYSQLNHIHDDRYYTESETDNLLTTKANIIHSHDDRYYTESETDNLLTTKANIVHLHDDRYFTESEINSLLSGYYTKTNLQTSGQSSIHWDNITSVPATLPPPIATSSILGGVKIGSGVNVAADGTISVTPYTHPIGDGNLHVIATGTTNGGKVLKAGATAGVMSWSNIDWSEILNKPTIYTPVAHTHTKVDVTDFVEGAYVHIAGDETITGNKTFNGNVTIQGTLTTINSQTLNLADNLITLNSDYLGSAPTENAGIEIERGTLTNASIIWDEANDKWKAGLLGSEIEISLLGHNHDSLYYTKTQLQTSGQASINWGNITNTPAPYVLPMASTVVLGGIKIGTGLSIDANGIVSAAQQYTLPVATSSVLGGVKIGSGVNVTIDGTISVTSYTHPIGDGNLHVPATGTTNNGKVLKAGVTAGSAAWSNVDWSEILNKPTTFVPSAHTHDDRYYTESEIDNLLTLKSNITHTHDDRYFTELEITSNYYSKTQLDSGQLDNRYFTETEINTLLANKSDISHNHDALYYRKEVIDAMASQYALIAHIHDDRYYTESEIDNLLTLKSNITHTHDDRYFTESELGATSGVSGASRIGISLIGGMTATNVQTALQELKTSISTSSGTLQQAYTAGKVITATAGPVKIDSSTVTTAPLELTNRVAAPTAGLVAGQIAVIDNELYIYNSVKGKWLTPTKILAFARPGSTDGHMLYTAGGVAVTNSGYKMSKNGTIVSATIETSGAATNKDTSILVNDIVVYTLTTSDALDNNININFSAGDIITMYVSSNNNAISNPVVVLEIAWRK